MQKHDDQTRIFFVKLWLQLKDIRFKDNIQSYELYHYQVPKILLQLVHNWYTNFNNSSLINSVRDLLFLLLLNSEFWISVLVYCWSQNSILITNKVLCHNHILISQSYPKLIYILAIKSVQQIEWPTHQFVLVQLTNY